MSIRHWLISVVVMTVWCPGWGRCHEERPTVMGSPKDYAVSVAFSTDGNEIVYCGCRLHYGRLDVSSGKILAHGQSAGKYQYSVAVSNDATGWVTKGVGELIVYDGGVGDVQRKIPLVDTGFVSGLFVTGRASRVVVAQDRELVVYDKATAKRMARCKSSLEGRVSGGAIAIHGEVLAFGGEHGEVEFCSVERELSLGRVKLSQGQSSWVTAVSFLSDGKYLFAGCHDASVAMVNVPEKRVVARAVVGGSMTCVAVAPKQELVAVGCYGGTVTLFRTADLAKPFVIDGLTANICSVAISPDGKLLAVGDERGTVTVRRIGDGSEVWKTVVIPRER